ncbi:MAG TPA: tetratricopeptide repeat protein [Candidatus Acidoferrum sp.]|nr:tetratricopeptide repeat protein [Candidatus Acidoferrum sp.]
MTSSSPTQIWKPSAIFACLLFFCAALLGGLHAQENQPSPSISSTANLSQRLAAALEARNSGDPAAIGRASEKVLALALAEMAKLRLDENAYEEAIRLGEQSLRFEDAPETRVEVALASLYAKKPSDAAKQASAAAALDPQNALAWKIKGEALLQSRDYAGASEAFGRDLELKQDAESFYSLGVAQLGTGEKQKADDTFAHFLQQVGDSGGARVLVGRAYQDRGLTQDAVAEFQKALLLNSATPNAHYFWAIALLQGNGWVPTAEVHEQLRAELQRSPRHFEANYMLGSLASSARNDGESDRYLHLAAEIKPAAPETWVLLGLNAQRRKSNQAAIAYFRKAIAASKNLDPKEHFEVRKAYFGLGRLLLASGQTKVGQELLGKAKQLQVQMLAENRKNLAATNDDATRGMGDDAPYIPEAESDGQPHISLSSASVATATEKSYSKSRGTTHSRSDSQGKEEAYLSSVLGASYNDLATAEALEGKYQDAFTHYRDAGRWAPQIPGLQRNLGLAAYFAGQPSEAIRLLSKAVAPTPDDSHARAVLGLAYFSSGNFSKTVQTILPIAKQALQDPELALAWATSQAQTGNKAASTQALESLQASGKLPEAIDRFEHSVRTQPSSLAYHLGLEAAYRKAGRAAEADQQQSICESLKANVEPAKSSNREKTPQP